MRAIHPIDTLSTIWSLTVGHAVIVAGSTADVRLAACAVGERLAIEFAIPATRTWTEAEVIAYHLTLTVFSGLMSLGECTSALIQAVSSSVSSNANCCEKLHCLEVFVVLFCLLIYLAN